MIAVSEHSVLADKPILRAIESLAIPTPSTDELQLVDSSKSELEVAQAFEIVDNDMYELAGQSLTEIKTQRANVEARRDEQAKDYVEVKRRAEAVRKAIFDFFDPIIANYKNAESVLTQRCVQYLDAQRRAREETERKAREEQQRAERAAAEQARIAREAAEELERQAEAARAAGNTDEAEKLATSAIAKADEAADIELAVPIAAPPVVTTPEPPKLSGVGFAKKWKGRLVGITDAERSASKLKLIQFVAANPQFINLLDVNEPALNKQADSLRSAMKIDGVEAYQDAHSRRQA